jgi:hypothetical protein
LVDDFIDQDYEDNKLVLTSLAGEELKDCLEEEEEKENENEKEELTLEKKEYCNDFYTEYMKNHEKNTV